VKPWKRVKALKEDYPDFNPRFDKDFFKMPKKGPFQRLLGWIKG